ncbi:ribosomal protein uS13 [Candidatus Synchoanobacter obligatus]|uniref:30S ribosomal protein S13 n=1 Tax=Candidatus Synchoanobacter obligatus TaxID=2919597 RepID=A0ABT1L5P9_9GAMM|nr:ribosomal protein uS13 [Candidatus Synchoanobacter obligatus]MCP8352507.1 ribosomal protein uS13 [Candidatus Synchoanobacter obligatus]
MTIIAGSRLAENQHIWVGLTRIYGVGKTRAYEICELSNIAPDRMVKSLSDKDVEEIRHQLTGTGWDIGTALRRAVNKFISVKKMIRSYQGRRHAVKLPVRGQRTKTNAKSARRRRDS